MNTEQNPGPLNSQIQIKGNYAYLISCIQIHFVILNHVERLLFKIVFLFIFYALILNFINLIYIQIL